MSDEPPPFRVPEHVLFRKLEDEIVLLNLDSGEYFGLNDTGARVWELLVEGSSRPEIVACLIREFEVLEEAAKDHVRELCAQLVEAGLLETGSSSDRPAESA